VQQGAASVAGDEPGGLPRQGQALLLAPAVPVGVVRREHACGALDGQLTAEEAVPTCGSGGARTLGRAGDGVGAAAREVRWVWGLELCRWRR
jgi:hypothetical protein